MNDFYWMVYGIPFVSSIAVALVFCAWCWLLEWLLGRRIGVYAGYAGILMVCVVILHLIYFHIAECSGIFGWPVLLAPCESSTVTKSLAAFLTIAAMPLLILSEIRLRRWSLNRARHTH
jgi:hypothetical protein